MRKGLAVAVCVACLLMLSGCSGGMSSTPPKPTEYATVGTSRPAAPTAPATETTAPATNPAAEEGMPEGLGVQLSAAEGATAIGEAEAIRIAERTKPDGTTTVSARHVLFAESGAEKPVDAWMVTFHDAQLPGTDSGASAKTGSVTVFIDSSTGDVVDEVAYEPVGK